MTTIFNQRNLNARQMDIKIPIVPVMLLVLYEVNTVGSFYAFLLHSYKIWLFTGIHYLYTHGWNVAIALIATYIWLYWSLHFIHSYWMYALYTALCILLYIHICYILLLKMNTCCVWYIYRMQLLWFANIFLCVQYAVSYCYTTCPNCVIYGFLYVHNTNLLFLCFALCSNFALGNNVLHIAKGLKLPLLPYVQFLLCFVCN